MLTSGQIGPATEGVATGFPDSAARGAAPLPDATQQSGPSPAALGRRSSPLLPPLCSPSVAARYTAVPFQSHLHISGVQGRHVDGDLFLLVSYFPQIVLLMPFASLPAFLLYSVPGVSFVLLILMAFLCLLHFYFLRAALIFFLISARNFVFVRLFALISTSSFLLDCKTDCCRAHSQKQKCVFLLCLPLRKQEGS